MLTQVLHVNFSSLTVPHLISVVQGDTGRNLKCIVDDFTLDGAWTATWYVERPSDVPVYNTATIETSDNSVNLELTAQSINEVGDNKLQVRILDADDQVVTSFACILSVKPFGGIGAVESSTEANIFDQAVEQAITNLQTRAEEVVEGVIESIPVDYTALTEEVDNLDERLSDVKSQITKGLYPVKNVLVAALNKNRFDGTIQSGYLTSNGTLALSGDWVTTDLIYVGDLSAIICSGRTISSGNRSNVGLLFICTYDANGTFIEQVGTNYGERYTVTSGVSYIRFSYHSDVHDQIQVESGSSRTAYEPYNYGALADKVGTNETDIATLQSAVSEIQTDVAPVDGAFTIQSGKNRFDGATTPGYLTASGSITSGSDWVTTNKIFVGDAYEIICSAYDISAGTRKNCALSFICSYDWTGTFIEQVGTNYPERYVVESGVAYIRFSYHSDTFNQVQVESGYNRTDYQAYSAKGKYAQKWYGKQWAVIGDSLTEVNSRSTMRYHDYVARNTGISVYNMGVSGTGYAKGKDSDIAFYQRTSSTPASTDVVTIFGSGNDGSSGLPLGTASDTEVSTICGCVNTALDNLFAALPLANVGIVSPTPWIDQPPTDPTNFMSQYSTALGEICKRRGIPFLDLYHCSGLRPWESSYRAMCYTKDDGNGVHPDETGHRIIAPHFEAFLERLLLH